MFICRQVAFLSDPWCCLRKVTLTTFKTNSGRQSNTRLVKKPLVKIYMVLFLVCVKGRDCPYSQS